MKRKIISLAIMLCLLSSTVVSAGEFDSQSLVDNAAQVKIPVTATINSTFTVSLPASLELTADGSQYTYSSTVGVKGDTNIESAVTVVPMENIVVYDVTNRPKELTETPTAESEQESYEHKVPQPVTISQEKTSWAYTDLSANVDAFVETPITATATTLTAGEWEGVLKFVIDYSSTYIAPTSLTLGETYSFGGYNWVAAEQHEGYVTLQSTGVTAGQWPGYKMAKFGNGDYYASNIDGQDISEYDDKTTALYNSIKSAEYDGATYGKGLFLANQDMGNSTYANSNYNTALKTATANHSSFGASASYAWLGTFNGGNYVRCVSSGGGVSSSSQHNSYVVAPAFNLDTSKVTLEGNVITVK